MMTTKSGAAFFFALGVLDMALIARNTLVDPPIKTGDIS